MNLKYVIKEGTAGFKRAKLAVTTSIFSLFIAVLLLGILGRISYNVYTQAMSLKEVVLEVFLFDMDERSTDEIRMQLEDEELVTSIEYISKDSASVVAAQDLGAGVDDLIELNFLPASFRVNVNTDSGAELVENLASRIQNIRGVDEVKYNKALVQALESNLSTFTLIGGGLGILILLAAVVLVYNTIRLTIHAKKDLIRAMKLVGATNGFIRSPFIVEGIVQGIIAGGLSVLCVFAIFEFFVPAYLPDIGIVAWPFGRWYFLVGAMVGLAVLMGWWGSRLASRKYIAETYISGS
ncbi:cell division protein FtsX [Balneola vulgaris]|uniref:cell division protein FtsX n=1 Tax=Balneola vulgaris TaxID=287535 RepID=UPI00035F3FC1|nr:permease-like cell division protein FtsX [Balneola vulgaris]